MVTIRSHQISAPRPNPARPLHTPLCNNKRCQQQKATRGIELKVWNIIFSIFTLIFCLFFSKVCFIHANSDIPARHDLESMPLMTPCQQRLCARWDIAGLQFLKCCYCKKPTNFFIFSFSKLSLFHHNQLGFQTQSGVTTSTHPMPTIIDDLG